MFDDEKSSFFTNFPFACPCILNERVFYFLACSIWCIEWKQGFCGYKVMISLLVAQIWNDLEHFGTEIGAIMYAV